MKQFSFAKWMVCFTVLFFSITRSFGQNAVVAQDGSGNYTTVQAAINAAPVGATTTWVIYIKNGKYNEVVNIPSTKPFIQLVGQSVANTIIQYNNGASTLVAGSALGTAGSATLTVNANDCSFMNLTIRNTFGDGSQAVAVEINADRVAFKNCRLMGNQDTLYTKGAGNPRHYFRNCYIDGNIDFIFGSSIDIFDSCVIYAKTRTTSGSSFCTAANTTAGQAYGYVFRNCILPANTLGTSYYLGRPWQNSLGFTPTSATPQANNKVAYINCTLGAHINPVGWVIWDSGTDTTKITDAEYQSKNFDGTLTNVSQRVTWSQQINSTQASAYMATSTIFSGWDPCPVIGCGAFTPDIAVSNFAGVKGATVSTFSWNISWPIAGVTYTLYRSTDSTHYSPLSNAITSANDTNVNFQLTDPIPPQGGVYYYYIQATKSGLATHITDTVVISSAPTITLTGAPGILTQYLGTPSGGSPYTVSGVNLTAGVIITPPLNFEISSDGGITWHNSTSPITLAPTSGVLVATNILARLNASANGTYTGNILHTTIGGLPKYDSVSGTTSNPPAYTETVLEEWPFTANNLDSAGVRALGITATVPVMQHLYLSNGTTVSTIPAYSPQFGEAFSAANSTGDGTWSASIGGPGGTLNRTIYQQFTVTPGANYMARVDSFILNASFNGSSSGTSMMVVYSKSNFVSDSTNIYGYGFATSGGVGVQDITLPNQTGGPTANWRLGLVGGGSGVTLNHGDTLTVRVYFTCSSSSAGRYATVLNVIAKGFTTQLPAVLEEWPFTTNNLDSTAVRATGVAASVPTLSNLYLSTGTPAAYTPAFGQALSAGTTGGATAGDGHWGTAYGGPGGNLSHIYYEQFTVTPTAGYSVRVDSFILNAGFYGTSSTTSMMVVYSKSNFVSDSTNAYGYGWLIPSAGTAPNIDVALPNQTSANSTTTRLGLLSTANGVTINPGTTLTFRVYFTCSSSSAGKYAELLNVYAKGISTPLPCPNQPGTITASIANICAGQTNAIYSVPNDTTVNSYTWAFSGSGATFSSTRDSVAVNFANNAGSGILSVVANATCGISTASTLPVIVNALPADSITTTNSATNICGSGTLTLNANTGTGYIYQWSKNNATISGATSASYNASTAGTYTVSITNPVGCSAASQAFAVTVGGVPAAITAPASTIICGNGYLVLNGNTGTGYSYQWQLNGANTTNTTATDTASAAGAYNFILTDASGCKDTSSAVTVTVGSLPADTVSAATSTSFCAGGSVVLNASATSGATYQLLNNGVAISGATTGSYTAGAAGKYSVIVTGSNTCTDTSAKTLVVVHPLPVPVITESSKVLSTGAYTTYQWSFNGANVATSSTLAATVNGNGVYTVTVTDSNGCSNTSAPDTVTDVVGVANVNLAKYITLYPNPATDIVHIDAPLNVNAAITGMDGRQIFFKNDAKDINISALAPGVYLIMIYDGNMLIKTDKLLKN